MKRIMLGLLSGILFLTACGQTPSATQASPISIVEQITSTPSPFLTDTITPTPAEMIQNYPFFTETPNPTALAVANNWGTNSAMLSPDGNWAATSFSDKLEIIQIYGEKKYEISCEAFLQCEFVVPIKWSPDSTVLYVAPFLTGEIYIPFRLYAGVARFDIYNERFEKIVNDSLSEIEYDVSLSPNGKLLAITNTTEVQPNLTVVDTTTREKVIEQAINDGSFAGDILWDVTSEEIIFVSITNCESSVYKLNIRSYLKNGKLALKPKLGASEWILQTNNGQL